MKFSDIFKSSFIQNITEFSLLDTVIALLFSLAVGLFILLIYKKTFAGVMYSRGLAISLTGLSLVTTLVILAVTSNVVLSLGMVGALSIVRFRAAVKEPMEIVFLFWSLAAGIVIGAGMIPLAVIGSVIIGLSLLVISRSKGTDQSYILTIRCTDEAAEKRAADILRGAVRSHTIKAKTVRAGETEITAQLRLKDGDVSFVNTLSKDSAIKDAVLVSYNGEYMS